MPDHGELRIEIEGLPSDVDAAVEVLGPEDFEATLTSNALLEELGAGTYQVQAAEVNTPGGTYFPNVSPSVVEVEPDATAVVEVTYIEGAIALPMPSLLNLPITRSMPLTVEVEGVFRDKVEISLQGTAPAGLEVSPSTLVLEGQTSGSFEVRSIGYESEMDLATPAELTFEARSGNLRAEATVSVLVSFNVSSAEDAGPGTLRELVALSASFPGHLAIGFEPDVFSAPTTIVLESPIPITHNVDVQGLPGDPPLVRLDAGGEHPLFLIDAEQNKLEHLVIHAGSGERGGCIQNFGHLELSFVQITGCHASESGGAIANLARPGEESQPGHLVISESLISGNLVSPGSPDGRAGGIYSEGSLRVENSRIEENEAGIHLDIHPETANAYLQVRESRIWDNSSKHAGGGIYTSGIVDATIEDSDLQRNHADGGGGAIYSEGGGKWTLTRSVVAFNSSLGSGGGLAFVKGSRADASLTVERSEIVGNEVHNGGDGGGIFSRGPIFVSESTIRDNSAGNGGGIYQSGPVAVLTLMKSTLEGNAAIWSGGAIYSQNAESTLENGTITDNYAEGGAGLFVSGARAAVLFSTISENEAGYQGGGIEISFPDGEMLLYASIVANNTAMLGRDFYSEGQLTAGGYSLVGVHEGSGLGPGDFDGTDLVGSLGSPLDPMLGWLSDNGGPTRTMAPRAGSPALDHIPDCALSVFGTSEDQRGESRTGAALCDIGSVELQ